MDSEKNKVPLTEIGKNNTWSSSSPDIESNLNNKNSKKGGFWRETLKFLIIAVFIVLPIRLYVLQPFIVSGPSMDQTFADGQYLLVDEISYRFEEPKRGDVVIFKYPLNTKQFFIKRIIGLPGETVEIKDDVVTIKNTAHPDGFILSEPYVDTNGGLKRPDVVEKTLSVTEYFVMGDNRYFSSDSRIWGPVERKLIVGEPLWRLIKINKLDGSNYFPFSFLSLEQLKFYPGAYANY